MGVRLTGWGWRPAGRRSWSVRGLDLVVEPGQRVLLLGASGAGKTTVLRGLAGLLDPASAEQAEGELLLDGRPAREARGRAGLVGQDPVANLVLARVGDDVAFGLENRGVPSAQIWPAVHEALDAVGVALGLDAQTVTLSGGEAQRVAIAGAIAPGPGLLLLDEPTVSLDPEGVQVVRAAVGRVLERTGATLVLVEHRPAPWLDLVDRVVVLAGGGVAADGPPEQVLSDSSGAALAAAGVWVPGFEPAAARAWAGPAPGAALLLAHDVRHRHRGAAVDTPGPTSLAVHAGEAVALTGRNGGGKTTLALALGGVLRPSGGTVTFTGSSAPLHTWRAAALADAVGSVFQRPEQQFLTGRVDDEVALGLRGGRDAPARVADLLERLGLERLAGADPHTLSGGEQRRLSVATALATRARVLVLDEPSFGQDALTWAALVELGRALLHEGRGLVTVTHDRDLVGALGARELRVGTPLAGVRS